ncbi:MAG: T9SS type A sorting domain-containing protein, partial [Ignavibacteria bacterium]|nr:T9SS type A sorting domain-containing protein [Ignavibacteria bacterium]
LKARFTQLMSSPNPIEVMLNMHSSSLCTRYFVYHHENGTSSNYALLQQQFINGVRSYFPNAIEPYNYFVSWTSGTALQYPESWCWLNHGENIMALTYEDMYQCSLTGKFDSTANAILRGVMDYMEIVVVPVELTSFTAQAQNQKILLKWTIATELNNNGFEIQRRVAESDFATIGFVRGEGTTTNQTEYSYIDKDLTDGKYYYRLKQIDFNGTYEYSDVVEVEITPLHFSLDQNYPNPFNPSTKISWQSPVSSWQTLKVYDILGNEIATLVNEYRNAGSYEVEFSAIGGSASGGNVAHESLRAIASGIYFYRLQAGNLVETKKMILLK